MCYDDDFGGYDDNYDAGDDIYAGTAFCDDGSDQEYDDRFEGEDIEGELGAGEDTGCSKCGDDCICEDPDDPDMIDDPADNRHCE